MNANKSELTWQIKCKACGSILQEHQGLDDECPECGANGGKSRSWWTYL